jgi:hypothetical protein
MPSQVPFSLLLQSLSPPSSIEPLPMPPTPLYAGGPGATVDINTSSSSGGGGLMSWFKDPVVQSFSIVGVLFILTVLLGLINFCIWYIEKRRRRGPVHWRSAPIVDLSVTGSRPITQPPKRSFHIQHALYKSVRRPSSMPPWFTDNFNEHCLPVHFSKLSISRSSLMSLISLTTVVCLVTVYTCMLTVP